MKKTIYFDNAATTKLNPAVYDKMRPFLEEAFENPSGLYSGAVSRRKAINDARSKLAKLIGANEAEIIFTGGGSEGDNLALIGTAFANKDKGRHIITTNIEHHAVLESAKFLERNGFCVTYVPVRENGTVDVSDIEKNIRPDTILISVMAANNEIGTNQPIKEIGELASKKGILFHTDAVQAFSKMALDVDSIHCDLLSVSGHKFGGPKGVGFLYVRRGTRLEPVIHGGAQEYGLRAGTENTPGIVGLCEAACLACGNMAFNSEKERTVRDYLKKRIFEEIPDVSVNGDLDKCLPNILNVSIKGIEGESLLIMLDMKGICASTGSACVQSLREPSHVIRALSKTDEEVRGSVRFSLGPDNTLEEADETVEALKESVEYLRKMRFV